MAYYSIEKRPRADGTVRYRCTVGVKSGGKYIYRENRTFGKQSHAKTWGAMRVAELEQNGVPTQNDTEDLTVGDLLHKYINDPDLGGKAGRTKKYVLGMLLDSDLAKLALSELSVSHVIEYCKQRYSTGITPSTINHDVSYLTSVLKSAKPIYNIDYVSNPAYEARPLLLQMGLIGKSKRRSRRPMLDEIDKLIEGLRKRSNHREGKIPYEEILNFSILSCMRIGEVCKIRWDDIDEKQKAVIVRDRKDPRKKTGNHMSVPLLGDAWEIVQRQPKTSELIFPYNPKSVTAGFQRVRNALGIQDLRYHDLRREGASRLFEAGFSIEEVAQVTGHRSLNVLWQVYTELYPQSLHEKFNKLMQQKEE
ncbi:site-specific integrase [Xenorhabdus sp. DI]|uniref:tyrosine-type recombinase/integrase n=1 Tax=Xenorhabdus doucetiae TaxID=351671 RepID=UPI001991F12E|nr:MULTISPECIES: site-specific integrase [unclassified Xenorhabdus]MBD2784445.1 site-specific integrase [Xenorhabdus sp. 3]MBD2789476.1 site-specific integrase [Xenorhabdus sp. DI]